MHRSYATRPARLNITLKKRTAYLTPKRARMNALAALSSPSSKGPKALSSMPRRVARRFRALASKASATSGFLEEEDHAGTYP